MKFEALLNSPFVQVALPIMVTLFLASWIQNKRFDDFNRQFAAIINRLDRIKAKLENHATRITVLEERTSPLSHR